MPTTTTGCSICHTPTPVVKVGGRWRCVECAVKFFEKRNSKLQSQVTQLEVALDLACLVLSAESDVRLKDVNRPPLGIRRMLFKEIELSKGTQE